MDHNPVWNRTAITSTVVAYGLMMPAAHADNQYVHDTDRS